MMVSSQHVSEHGGSVHNVVTGTVGGSVVQAGDFTGATINFGDGEPVVVAQGKAAPVGAAVTVPADLTDRMVGFLRQVAAGELSPRTAGQQAEELAVLLDDLR